MSHACDKQIGLVVGLSLWIERVGDYLHQLYTLMKALTGIYSPQILLVLSLPYITIASYHC